MPPGTDFRCPLSIPLWCDWDVRWPVWGSAIYPSFNPTVVRLGRGRGCLAHMIQPPFNPTVVRLGLAGGGSICRRACLLSIPLWCDWDRITEIPIDRECDTFNPTVVRLGPCLRPCRPTAATSFNPTVVRLGPLGPELPTGRHLPTFQSHCGAIGTPNRPQPRLHPGGFQSHCGAIGTK